MKEANMAAATNTKIDRIDPQTTHRHLSAQGGALLVCAYDDSEKFKQNRLEGALSLRDFEAQAKSLEKDREIIFYCA
jgi:hypothetical protein